MCLYDESSCVAPAEERFFFLLCYIDNFVGVEATEEKAAEAYACINELACALGLQISLDKCVPPSTSLTQLGFTTDTVSISVSILSEKVTEVLDERAL